MTEPPGRLIVGAALEGGGALDTRYCLQGRTDPGNYDNPVILGAQAREGLALLFRKRDALYAADGVELPNLEITEQVIRALLDKINPEQIPEQPAVADTEPRESS